MSLHRLIILALILLIPARFSLAGQGFFGFSKGTPLSENEKNAINSFAPRHITNYRQKMRDTLNMLTSFAHKQNKNFQITAHEGRELLDIGLYEASLEGYNIARNKILGKEDTTFLQHNYQNKNSEDSLVYLKSLDGILLNNLFCPSSNNSKFPNVLKENKIKIASVEYCPTEEDLDEAIQESVGTNIMLYAFTNPKQAFRNISKQMIINENAKNIFEIKQAQNILILTNDKDYNTKAEFILALRNTNFDIVIIPALFHEKEAYTKDEINSLKIKKNGTSRLVLAELNISEISPEQIFWNKEWNINQPTWIKRPSIATKNAYITEYWHPKWQKMLSFYMKGIVDSGFSGVLYTGLNNYEYFDKLTPLD